MLKRTFLLFFMIELLIGAPLCGQPSVCDSVYLVVDEMPRFGEKDEDLNMYLIKNLKFGKCGLDEMRILTWTIDKAGHMIDIDAPNLEGQCKQNIVNQLKEFPDWNPGRRKGRPAWC